MSRFRAVAQVVFYVDAADADEAERMAVDMASEIGLGAPYSQMSCDVLDVEVYRS